MRNETLSILLAGGKGARLEPLTNERSKPAVPFGGKYRIIDFTLANCLHSGMRRVLVLTQYKSLSLHRHLRDAWSIFNPDMGEYITSVPPQMRTGEHWYSGTADAVFQNLYLLQRSGAKWVLILSGDHIYRMDYGAMIKFHRKKEVDLTIASMAVPLKEATKFGVLSINTEGRIVAFEEKPLQPKAIPDDSNRALVSMGVYVFSIELLIKILVEDAANDQSSHDFGADIIPKMVNDKLVYAYYFGGQKGRVTPDYYWRDVGTIDSYYEANMDLLETIPPLNLYQPGWPIRSYQTQSPPLRAVRGPSGGEGVFINSLGAGGVIIAGGEVYRSILFSGVFIDDLAMVRNVILFEGVRVGANVQLQNCIVDKDVKIPDGESIGFDLEKDSSRFFISENGIVVVPKNYSFG